MYLIDRLMSSLLNLPCEIHRHEKRYAKLPILYISISIVFILDTPPKIWTDMLPHVVLCPIFCLQNPRYLA